MNELLIGLVGAVLATNQPQAVSNLIQQNVGVSVSIVNPNDPAEKELQRLMDADDMARTEIDKWIQDNAAFAKEGAGESNADLNQRIRDRLNQVRKGYEDLLQKYPNFARAHLAYGSFLNELGEEEEGAAEFEKTTLLDPKNPAAWNNLGNYHGHRGPVTNAFTDYARAIELNPAEPVYYQNLATTVYLFRKDAREFFNINEQQVFDKALELYVKALKLNPDDFPLATDLAQSYYGIKPLRTNDALIAWTNALNIAHDEVEREGVYIHLARVKIAAGRFDEARAHLAPVTNAMYDALKTRLERNIVQREHPQTNAEIAEAETNLPEVATNVVPESMNPIVTAITPVLTNEIIASTNAVNIPTNPEARFIAEANAETNITNILTNVVIAPTNFAEVSNNVVEMPKVVEVPTNPLPTLTNNIELTNTEIISTNEADIFKNFMISPPTPRLLPAPRQ